MADRHPKRTVVFFTQTAMMVLAFVFAALVWSRHIRPWHILVPAALGGVAMAFDMPVRQAFMLEMISREKLMNAVSLNSSIVKRVRVGRLGAGTEVASSSVQTGHFQRIKLMAGNCLLWPPSLTLRDAIQDSSPFPFLRRPSANPWKMVPADRGGCTPWETASNSMSRFCVAIRQWISTVIQSRAL